MNNPITASTAAQLDYILIDSSRSMSSKWLESLTAVDSYIAALRAANVPSQVILHMFYRANPGYIHFEGPIDTWKPLCANPPMPSGMTPLYHAIDLMGLRLRALDPMRASIVIVTDGEDSGFDGSSLTQARDVLDWLRAKGYQITFIGADFSNSSQARLLGAENGSAIGVQRALLSDAATALARKRANYGLFGTPMHFTESEQTQFGGYLTTGSRSDGAPGAKSAE